MFADCLCLFVLVLSWFVLGTPASAEVEPFIGKSVAGVDCSTLTGKVMCGYQGWFATPDDGFGLGWMHYQRGREFSPGSCCFDLWPDLGEFDQRTLTDTPFHFADGSVARLASSTSAAVVDRHFAWMQQYGIDGVFVQRFGTEIRDPHHRAHFDAVLSHCRDAANAHGRAYAVMYDLSGLESSSIHSVAEDWKTLCRTGGIGFDPKDHAYLHHGGKPVVALWGIGFNDHRHYTLADCLQLIKDIKSVPAYGGVTVMVGVPTGWRTLDRDAVPDPQLLDVISQADIISPWTVGRYTTPEAAVDHGKRRIAPDLAWCRSHDKEYLPVVFPGFSWHNLKSSSPLNQIPRLKGQFFWSQCVADHQAGASMLYVAMFDEINEGTAIFKCTDHPPVGNSPFLDLEGQASDRYLWLTGQAGRLLTGKVSESALVPER